MTAVIAVALGVLTSVIAAQVDRASHPSVQCVTPANPRAISDPQKI